MPGQETIRGYIEKKKDWIERARDYQHKEKKIRRLRQKAKDKNPDEFHYHMINSKVRLDGVHEDLPESDEETETQKLLSDIHDLQYVTHKLSQEQKKIEKLRSVLHFPQAVSSKPTTSTRILFVDSVDDAKMVKEQLTKVEKQETSATSTEAKKLYLLLYIIDDIELISKEMIENAIAPKHLKLSGPEYVQLTDLLVAKDNELKDTLKLAAEQAQIDKKMDILKGEVERQDQDINQLQKQLKEAEQILSTAIYQANQKLQSIARANKRPVHSEELIKFAHRISASNAVCAPLTWQQGDPRRPYPTDIEMRLGHLGRFPDTINGPLLPQNNVTDIHRQALPGDIPASQQNQFSWHPCGEIHMSVGQGSVPMDTRNHKQETEDVEVMSTDSSSSSSSDSQ